MRVKEERRYGVLGSPSERHNEFHCLQVLPILSCFESLSGTCKIPNHSIWISDVREDNNFSTYTIYLVTTTHNLADLFFRPFLPYPSIIHIKIS